MSAQPNTFAERLLAAEQQLPSTLTRDAKHSQAGYAYLSESGAVAPVREALLAAGIAILIDEASPPVRETAAPRIDKQTGALIEQHAITVHLQVRLIDQQTGQVEQTASLYGSAIDRDGRGHASARTDALKGLRQVFALAAEEPTKEDRQRPAAKPLTADDVARKAADLGYTDEQRDFIISAEGEAVPASARALAELQPEHLQAALDVLSDPAALEYAQAHTPTAQPA